MKSSEIPLPKDWPKVVKSGTIHVIGLAQFALSYTRAWALCGRNERARHKAELAERDDRIAQLEEQVRLLRSRFGRIPSLQRPHYVPTERLSTLQLKAARGWSNAECARQMLLSPQTVADWMKGVDDPDAMLFKTKTPINRYPDFVEEMVRRLKALSPSMGAKKTTDTLAKSGLHLALSTTRRMLKRKPRRREPPSGSAASTDAGELSASVTNTKSRIVSKGPGHTWLTDITTVARFWGYWVPWWPFSVPTFWPFTWHIVVVKDHFSRKVLGIKAFDQEPTAKQLCAVLRASIKRHGAPRHFITDQGSQFRSGRYRALCKRYGIKPRFGAIGKSGSIALIERFHRSLKEGWLRRIVLPAQSQPMNARLVQYVSWFGEHRPHEGLGGATPDEVFYKRKWARDGPRWEPRPRFPFSRKPSARAPEKVRGKRGVVLELRVNHLGGCRQLPVVELRPLRRAA